jgi:hypothetical protein
VREEGAFEVCETEGFPDSMGVNGFEVELVECIDKLWTSLKEASQYSRKFKTGAITLLCKHSDKFLNIKGTKHLSRAYFRDYNGTGCRKYSDKLLNIKGAKQCICDWILLLELLTCCPTQCGFKSWNLEKDADEAS